MEKERNYEVLGVVAPFLDHLLHVSEQYLNEIPGTKYGREPVEYSEILQIIARSGQTPKLVAGGSCANTIKGLASLGRKCALTGKIGNDRDGEKLLKDLLEKGVTPLLYYSSTPTGHVASLITPDSKRTCRSYLGASNDMEPEDLDPAHFKNVNIVHIEGYSLQNEKVTEKAMRLAKESGALVSLDLGSFEIVNQYKSTILGLLEKYVDLVFTNKDETLALTGFPPEKGCEQIKNLCEIAVVMIGKEGSWVGWGDETHRCPTFQVEAIDTTGAGDLFASGFLHALLEGKPAEECAKWGAITASTVVQVIGAEIPPEKWKQIKDRLGNP